MGEGPQRPVGERRRRREAARAAQRAAEQAGVSRPLTRRELRWREAEDAARLEAIATGELPIGEVQEALDRAAAATVTPEVAGTRTTGAARSAASAQSAPAAPDPVAESPAAESPAAESSSPAGASRADDSSVTSAVTAGSASGARSRPPSRRSLRERTQDAENAPEERPSERTATARRPVVRTPTTAQGIRVIDATGQLTGIQPVVRPDEPSSARPTGPGAVESEHFTVELDVPAQTARDALAAQSVPPADLRGRGGGPVAQPADTARHTDATGDGGSADVVERPDENGRPTDVVEPVAATSPADQPVATSPPSPMSSDAVPAGAGTPAGSVLQADDTRDEDDGHEQDFAFTLRPQWVAISSVSGVSPDEATSAVPSRRSVRTSAEDLEDTPAPPVEEEPSAARGNPAAALVKVAVLAVVAVIIGALIWLLATEALSDDVLGDARAPITWTITDDHEETSAR